jgi:hypothetical protein
MSALNILAESLQWRILLFDDHRMHPFASFAQSILVICPLLAVCKNLSSYVVHLLDLFQHVVRRHWTKRKRRLVSFKLKLGWAVFPLHLLEKALYHGRVKRKVRWRLSWVFLRLYIGNRFQFFPLKLVAWTYLLNNVFRSFRRLGGLGALLARELERRVLRADKDVGFT